MHILDVSPTDKGMFHKAPTESVLCTANRGFAYTDKALQHQQGLQTCIHTFQSLFLQIQRALQSAYTQGASYSS